MKRPRAALLPLCLIVFPLLVLSLRPSPGRGEDTVDLDLARRLEVAARRAAAFADPHDMECRECHEPDPAGESKAGPLRGKDDPDSVCLGCHPSSNLHPVGMPAAATTEARARVILPLGTGRRAGSVICLTCHRLHGKGLAPGLLRAPEGEGRARKQTLCALCHGDQLTGKSPHRKDATACKLCHTAPPKQGAAHLALSVQQTCDFCHDVLEEEHFLALNPFSDPALAGSLPLPGLPLVGGRFTCVTCHDPHGEEKGKEGRKTHLLRPPYLRLAARSVKINPHWKDVMCGSCHSGPPARGVPALLFSGRADALCNRCHAERFARREIHPVGVAPSGKVRLPKGYPLQEGRITCLTCHDSSLQEGGERLASAGLHNPKFLREGFQTRNEFCLRCHLLEEFGSLSAHDQLTPMGTVKEQSCLFCHSSLPDRKVPGIETVFGEEMDLDAYCKVCHSRHAINHPTANHLVEPSRAMLREIRSARDRLGYDLPLQGERITCVTCHNPHQPGVLPGDAPAGGGRGGEKRLRLNEGRTICLGCHTTK